MPSSNVTWPNPLIRQNAFETGQMGVPGTWATTGIRQHSTGKIVWVDPNYPGVWDGQGNAVDRDGTDPNDPCATITLAQTKCRPYRGDTIAVMANGFWTHAPKGAANYPLPIVENVTVTVHGVRIVGVFPSGSLGVPWMGAVTGDILTINAMDVLIEGFCFMGDPAVGANCDGIYAEWAGGVSGLWGDNLTVRHCFFDTDIQTAIELEFIYNADIHHNTFQGCDVAGIFSDGDSPIQDCHFHYNWFQEVGVGGGAKTGAISVEDAEDCKIDHNQIYNSAARAGNLATDEGINTTDGANNLVHHNILSCLLGVPANGDYDDFCSGDAVAPNETDAWIQNYCLNGPTVTNPT